MDNPTNYRTSLLMEPSIPSSNIMHPALGNVISQSPPALPPPPNVNGVFIGGNLGFGSYGNSYGGYGANYGGYGLSPFNYSGMGNGFGGGMYNNGFNSYGRNFGSSHLNPYDPESRFIQLAEENSRPAFESIGSLVSAVANIAAMLDSTFYAITSSFHAILGVAANFGQLRGVFSQFWQTFAIFRGLNWIYRKLLFWLKISNIDPSSQVFKEAFEAAKREAMNNNSDPQNFNKFKKQSPWPVVVFLGFIFTAPYVVMKLLGNLTTSVIEETKDPRRWVKPIRSTVLYDFQARNPSELTVKAGQTIYIAPKEIQNSQKLLNSGWALATVDTVHSGLIPITYCKKITNIPIESQTVKDSQSANSSQNVAETKLFESSNMFENENNLTIPKSEISVEQSTNLTQIDEKNDTNTVKHIALNDNKEAGDAK